MKPLLLVPMATCTVCTLSTSATCVQRAPCRVATVLVARRRIAQRTTIAPSRPSLSRTATTTTTESEPMTQPTDTDALRRRPVAQDQRQGQRLLRRAARWGPRAHLRKPRQAFRRRPDAPPVFRGRTSQAERTTMLPTLPEIAAGIRREHGAAMHAAGEAIRHGIECGRLLAAAKDRLAHGQWLPWLEDNTTFSHRTAQRWMRCLEHSERLPARICTPCAATPLLRPNSRSAATSPRSPKHMTGWRQHGGQT